LTRASQKDEGTPETKSTNDVVSLCTEDFSDQAAKKIVRDALRFSIPSGIEVIRDEHFDVRVEANALTTPMSGPEDPDRIVRPSTGVAYSSKTANNSVSSGMMISQLDDTARPHALILNEIFMHGFRVANTAAKIPDAVYCLVLVSVNPDNESTQRSAFPAVKM
jgi:hypothetical protein